MSGLKLDVWSCTELCVLDTLNDIESNSASPEAFLTQSIDSLLDHFGLDGGVAIVDLPSDSSTTSIVRGSAGPQAYSLLPKRSSLSREGEQNPVQVDQFEDPPHCWIGIPLEARGKRLGRLILASMDPRHIEQNQIALLRAAGKRLALTLDHLSQRQFSQTRIAQLAAINHVSTAITATLDPDQVYATILSQMRQVLGFDWAGLALLDQEKRSVLHLSMGQALPGYRVGARLTATQSPLGWASQYQRALLRSEIAASPPNPRFGNDSVLLEAGLYSDLTVPLFLGDRCVGAISLASQETQPYTRADLQLLRQVSDHAAVALENARLYENEKRRAQQLSQISRLVHDAATALDVERQLEIICDAQSLFAQGTFAVGFIDGDKLNWHPRHIQIPQRLGPVIERTLLTGRSQAQIDNLLEPSVLAVPLKISERTTGLVVLYSATGDPLHQSEQQMLETLAAQTSVTLENAHLFEMTLRQGALLEQRANRLAHILETSYDVLRLRPQTKDLWTQVCHIAQDALGFQTVAIYGLDNQHTLSLRALVGSPSPLEHQTCPANEFDRLLSPHARISRSYHIRYDDPSRVDATEALRCLAQAGFEIGGGHPAGTLLSPIEAPDGQNVGYLALGKPRDDLVPSLETIQSVEIFVNQVAIARENARLFAALEERLSQARRVNELAALHRLATAVSLTLETEHIQHAALSEIAHTLRPDVSAIWLLSPQGDVIEPVSIRSERDSLPILPSPLIRPEQLAAVLRDGRPQFLNSPGPEFAAPTPIQNGLPESDSTQIVLGNAFSCALLAPMSVRDQGIGVIGVLAQSPGRFDRQDLTLLDSMASTVAMAIENARLYAESKAFSSELAASQAQLVQSAKLAATGQLAASIAHEINNPLQAVGSCIYLIADGAPQDDPNVKYVEIARQELDRIARIVGRMLDFHHPGTEARQAIDVNELIENVLALVHKRLQHSYIVIQTDLAPDLPHIQAVGDHIKQVLLNLFLNALEAMPQGGILQVRTSSGHPEDKWLTISIQDNGIGMRPEDLAHLFEPFYTSKPSGTGLGLSISYDIVAQHGGEILVESKPGQGSTFTIRLPTSTGAQTWNKN